MEERGSRSKSDGKEEECKDPSEWALRGERGKGVVKDRKGGGPIGPRLR